MSTSPALLLALAHLETAQVHLLSEMKRHATATQSVQDWVPVASILCQRMHTTLEVLQGETRIKRVMNCRYALVLALLDLGMLEGLMPKILDRERTTARNHTIVNARDWREDPEISRLYRQIMPTK